MAGFTGGQRSVVLVAALALVIGAVVLTRWVAQPAWTPLYGSLSGEDANAIVEQLNADGVKYELADGGRTVLVPQAQVYDLRVALSGKGLPAAEGEGGYSLLDKQGITATDFQQNVAHRRALEGELAKTLQAMDGVRTAVVHLALPKKDVFATEEDKPTGSVLLQLEPGTELEREQVQAVGQMVAGSVESLDVKDVTITDASGRLLSSADKGAAGSAAAANEADEQTARFEDRMSREVQRVLDQVVGGGNSVVRVNAQLDFSTKDTTSEKYIADAKVPPTSESTTTESFNGSGAGAGGTLGRTVPDLTSSTGSDSGTYARNQRTINNPVGKVVERNQSAPGGVDRLTVAVVLNAGTAGTLDPTQVQQLVANAVGLDPQRGDSVQVNALPFDTTAAETAKKEIAEAEKEATMAGYIAMAKKAGLWLLVLLILFLAFKRRPKRPTIQATASDLPPAQGLLMPASAAAGALEAGGMAALTAQPQVSAERMRQDVASLVDNQPADVAQMLQGWLDERKV